MAPQEVQIERRADSVLVLRSPQTLGCAALRSTDWLAKWAGSRPDRTFLAERLANGEWRRLSYSDALGKARRIGAGLLTRGLGPERPLVILSENSIDHGLLALGAAMVGIPIVPVSTAYSLVSTDHGKLKQIIADVQPGMVYAADPTRYDAALRAIDHESISVAALLQSEWTLEAEAASARVGPDTVVKILYTSGSTGKPKGVLNTQRMVTTNQQQAAQVWRFLEDTPPVVVDWLPWSHTFGGNFTFHCVLAHGGTLYIDAGKPAPGEFEKTLRNLRDVSPTIYFNVPRGFDLLVLQLEQDENLRKKFFQNCQCIFYAAAALPPSLWRRIEVLAAAERGGDLALISAWGSTETAPMAAAVHSAEGMAGCIGLPIPGCELKLVPSAGKLEARLRGPNITPGYWNQPEISAQAFDEEGFYRIGDALRFIDADAPQKGLAFDGRVAEDFKLVTGTWVHVGALRLRVLEVGRGLIQDAVITGHDRDEIGALLFLNPSVVATTPLHTVRTQVLEAISRLEADHAGSSMRIRRVAILPDSPSLDAGEINDKGYVNQRQVLLLRSEVVRQLYEAVPDGEVVLLP